MEGSEGKKTNRMSMTLPARRDSQEPKSHELRLLDSFGLLRKQLPRQKLVGQTMQSFQWLQCPMKSPLDRPLSSSADLQSTIPRGKGS